MRADDRPLLPARSDPRWLILAFLLSFVAYALTTPGFSRTPLQFAAALAGALGVDAALLALRRIRLVPLSGLITSMGVLLLVDSPYAWPYFAVGALSVLSKQLIRPGGRHLFNPNDFGVVAGLLFFGDAMTTVAGRWGGSLPGMLLVAALGVLVVSRAGRLDLSASYALGFLALVPVRAALTGAPLRAVLAPMTGAAFQLFTFFMITDPRTSPSGRAERVAFGLSLAALDSLLRHLKIQNSPFYALFVLCGVFPALSAAVRAAVPRRTARAA